NDRFLVGVPDTLAALGELASWWRRRHPIPLVAVTGSNGKTTVKEMLASILEEGGRGEVLKSSGNFNNLVGLPLTLFGLCEAHRYAVAELGASEPGELRRLGALAGPQLAVITNVSPAHLEGFGDLEGVREAKGELLETLGPDGVAVLNGDDPMCLSLAERRRRAGAIGHSGRARSPEAPSPAGGQKNWLYRSARVPAGTPVAGGRAVTFGEGEGVDVRATEVELLGLRGSRFTLHVGGSRQEVRLQALGRHNVSNALAAAAAASLLGASAAEVAQGLARARPLALRMEVEELPGAGVHLLNDAYNANPRSVASALQALGELKGGGRAFLILGDMLELGSFAEEAHREVGRLAARKGNGADFLVGVGRLAALAAEAAREEGLPAGRVHAAPDCPEAARWVRGHWRPGDWVLVKGSRGMRMERAVEELRG
ncbi:MAG: UDP-N-acetylmuramoyl-tripeptide--D-alanyl-D-alanine ligase, partial [Nitrospinota bacterium]